MDFPTNQKAGGLLYVVNHPFESKGSVLSLMCNMKTDKDINVEFLDLHLTNLEFAYFRKYLIIN